MISTTATKMVWLLKDRSLQVILREILRVVDLNEKKLAQLEKQWDWGSSDKSSTEANVDQQPSEVKNEVAKEKEDSGVIGKKQKLGKELSKAFKRKK